MIPNRYVIYQSREAMECMMEVLASGLFDIPPHVHYITDEIALMYRQLLYEYYYNHGLLEFGTFFSS